MRKYLAIMLMEKISWSAKKDASFELFINTIFSTLPIWLGGGVYGCNLYFSNNGKTILENIFDSILKNVSNGELLMYSAATLGPILYFGFSSIRHKQMSNHWVRVQVTLAVLISFLSTALFFSSREHKYSDSYEFVVFSFFLYLFCLFLLWPSMAIEHNTKKFDASEAQRNDTDDYIAEYQQHLISRG